MIIEGIEQGIVLFIDDEEGNELADFFFHDFDEYNDFVKKHGGEYLACNASYSIVEVVNGTPEPFSWTKSIDMLVLDKDEIEEILEEYISDMKEDRLFSENYNKETELRPEEFNGADATEKLKWKNDYSYVCPYCMNELDECICSDYPYQLIQIDTVILPIIRILNQKGYKTTSCCGGHIHHNMCQSIYISFKEKYDFAIDYPDGGRYTSVGELRYDIEGKKTDSELVDFQKKMITLLLKWADMLPVNSQGE